MIVGEGLIANSLRMSDVDLSDALVVAAGVSNSSEVRSEAFERERSLLAQLEDNGRTVVYFSTVSIFDPAKLQTEYVRFKLEMEHHIQQRFARVLILRLPIVVSLGNNPNQLFGYFRSKLRNREKIYLYRNASRYLFHASDIAQSVRVLLDAMERDGRSILVQNVGFEPALSMADLELVIRTYFPDAEMELVEDGASYAVDFSEFLREVQLSGMEFQSSDPYAMVRTLFSQMKNEE